MNRDEASHVLVLFLRQHSRLMHLPVRKGLNKDVQVHKDQKHNRTDMQRSIETCNLFLHLVKVMNREEASHVPVLFL